MTTKIRQIAKKIIGPNNITLAKIYGTYLLWNLKGKPIPAHGVYKWKTLKSLALSHKINIFVETGTAGAGTVLKLEKYFKKLYTIELDPVLYEQGLALVKQKSKKPGAIECLKGDSGVVMKEVLRKLSEPAIFWLDAHYSGNGTARGAFDTPIVQELNTIFSHKIKDHVIVIDDAREFNGTNDYPRLEELKQIAAKTAPEYHLCQDNDLIIIKPIKT